MVFVTTFLMVNEGAWKNPPEIKAGAPVFQASSSGGEDKKIGPVENHRDSDPSMVATGALKRVQGLLNPFQQRLLKDAVVLEERRGTGNGEPDEQRLWRTDFKYPLIKEEVWKDNHEQTQRRIFSVADHLLVKFPASLTDQQIDAWAVKHAFYVRHSLQTTRVKLVATSLIGLNATGAILQAFRKDFPESAEPQVALAEKDCLVFPTLVPDDTSFRNLWGLHNTGQAGGVADADIDAPEAWAVTTGSREVLVGVIDTGIDRTHPDLAANIWANPGEIEGNGIDDDGNGFLDDVHGWDFFAGDRDPTDEDDHGTHCAGTIGAVGNNRAGVAGVCWQVSLVGIRFIGPSGGATSDAIECVRYATSLGVDLTSNSWGGAGESHLLREAIEDAGNEEILFVAAAGNDGTDNDVFPHYPASYGSENIISVASSTSGDDRSSFSNYGQVSVDLAAPGSVIFSTVPGPSYASLSGTSMAAPHVAGAVALVKSIAPQMEALPLKQAVLETVDRLPSFTTNTSAGGRLNVARLMEHVAGPYPLLTVTQISELPGGNGDGIQNPGETLGVHFTVSNRGTQEAANVVTRLTSSAGTASRYTITQGMTNVGTLSAGETVSAPSPFVVKASNSAQTPYAEEMIVTLSYGAPEELRIQRFNLRLYTSSQIAGQVTDIKDGLGLAGATVTFSGPAMVTATTGSDGHYSTIVTDGAYQASARAPGYLASGAGQILAPPGAADLNFVLSRPQLRLEPQGIAQTVRRGEINTQVIQMTNHGSAPLEWNLRVRPVSSPVEQSLKAMTVPSSEVLVPDNEQARTLQALVLPAVESALNSLSGVTIGAVTTEWDRSVLIADLHARGAVVVPLTAPFSTNSFQDIDALLLDDSIIELGASDIQKVRSAVRAGMGLLCEADNQESLPKANALLAETGIQPVYETFRDLTLTDILPHPITTGVSQLREVAVGWSAALSGAALPLVREISGRAHAAVSRLGRGTVVFVGNEITNSSNYADGDGRRFANQIMEGLVAGPDWLTVSHQTGILAPGTNQELTVSLDGRMAEAGTHEAALILSSKVPDEPDLSVPVSMTVVEIPRLVPSASSVDFGDVIERTPASVGLTLTNEGGADLAIEELVLSGAGAQVFVVTRERGSPLMPGGQETVKVVFRTDAPVGRHEAVLKVVSNDPLQPERHIPITGSRVDAPAVSLTPASIQVNLRQGQSVTRVFTVKNTGKGVLNLRTEVVFGTGQGWVNVEGGESQVLARGKSAKVTLRFSSGTLQTSSYAALFRLRSDDPDTPVLDRALMLTVSPAPVPVFAEGGLQFGKTYVGESPRQMLAITNGGTGNLTLHTALGFSNVFRLGGSFPVTIKPGETREFAVTFAPSAAGLRQSSLLFGANVPGLFFYVPVSGTGARHPVVRVTPASITLSAVPGVPLTRTVKVSNAGGEPLSWMVNPLPAEASWLTAPASQTRTLNGGAQDQFALGFATAQMPAGTYRTMVKIVTNDPKKPDVAIPVVLKVSNQAVLQATPAVTSLGEVWKDKAVVRNCELLNVGNLPMEILSVASSSKDLTALWPAARVLAPGEAAELPVSFLSSKIQSFKGSLTVKTRGRTGGTLKLNFTANVINPPEMEVKPSELNVTVAPGRTEEKELEIYNAGGAPLNWDAGGTAEAINPLSAGSLTQILQRIDARHASLAALIPNRHDFTEGESGYSIVDGGNNMYDNGNLFSTNLNGGQAVAYANGILSADASLGAMSRYFTRKQPGLFVLAADLAGPSAFRMSGSLGADGGGSASGAILRRHGYVGFLKRVYGTSAPSVNHLIILPDSPGLAHTFSTNTDLDDHEVTGLPSSTRLYALVFAAKAGELISDAQAARMMDFFVTCIAHEARSPWLQVIALEGIAEKVSSSVLKVQVDTRGLAAGTYSSEVHVTGNAPGTPRIDVPVHLTVPSAAVMALEPAAMQMPATPVKGTSTQTLLLRNVGNASLHVDSFSSSDPVFQISGSALPWTLPAGQSKSVQVSFSPVDEKNSRAQLSFISNSDATGLMTLPVSGTGVAAPLLEINPEFITLTTRPGVPVSQPITLKNAGTAPLQWSMSNTLTTGVLTPLSGTLIPGQSQVVTLTTVSTATTPPGLSVQSITVVSNDPLRPNLALPYSRIILAEPVLQVNPSPLVFEHVFLPGSAQKQITLRNTGNATLIVSSASLPSSSLSWGETVFPLILPPEGARAIDVRFSPTVAESFTGYLEFPTNHPDVPLVKVPVSGTAASPPCISVAPAAVNVAIEDGRKFSTALTVRNDGGSRLLWTVEIQPAEAANWLSLDHVSGATSAGGISYLGVNLTAGNVTPATRSATIRITSNALINGTVSVPVNLQVVPTELTLSTATLKSAGLTGIAGAGSAFQIQTRDAESPAWTVASNVPWIIPSVKAGQGPAEVTVSYAADLAEGSHSGRITVSSPNVTRVIEVTRDVLPVQFSSLHTDRRHNRVLGLVRGMAGRDSALVTLNPGSLALQQVVSLPTDIVDLDLSTDEKALYAISFSGKSITRVNLDSLVAEVTRDIAVTVTTAIPVQVQAGREGIVYYTDAASNPLLHVFDFATGKDLSTFSLQGLAGIGGFKVAPDNRTIYARSLTGTGNSGSSFLARVDCSLQTLVQTAASSAVLIKDSSPHPVLLGANLDSVITQERFFSLANLAAGEQGRLTDRRIYNASAYLDVLVTDSQILSADGQVLQALPFVTTITAFSPDQKKLICHDPATGVSRSVDTGYLPMIGIEPAVVPGSIQNKTFNTLSWTGDPTVAAYDVYLGTDETAVRNAVFGFSPEFLLSQAGTSAQFGLEQLSLGQTYYWRVDARGQDESVIHGPVWSFKMAQAGVSPDRVSGYAIPGDTAIQQTSLSIVTQGTGTSWTLSSEAAWVSLNPAAGTGNTTVTLSMNPALIPAGAAETTVTLKSGTDTVLIPVRFDRPGPWNIVKMLPDPVLPVVYALHRETQNPFRSWLLWVDPVTAEVGHGILLGGPALDFTVHSADDALYALVDSGRRVQKIQRQGSRQMDGAYLMPVPQVGICSAGIGKLVTLSEANALQLRQSANGTAIGSPVQVLGRGARVVANPAGSSLYAAVSQGDFNTGVVRYAVTTAGISFVTANYFSGVIEPPLLLSGNGQRLVYAGKIYETNSLNQTASLGRAVHAVSADASVVVSDSAVYSAATPSTPLAFLPWATTMMALMPDGLRLLLYSPTTHSFQPFVMPSN